MRMVLDSALRVLIAVGNSKATRSRVHGYSDPTKTRTQCELKFCFGNRLSKLCFFSCCCLLVVLPHARFRLWNSSNFTLPQNFEHFQFVLISETFSRITSNCIPSVCKRIQVIWLSELGARYKSLVNFFSDTHGMCLAISPKKIV